MRLPQCFYRVPMDKGTVMVVSWCPYTITQRATAIPHDSPTQARSAQQRLYWFLMGRVAKDTAARHWWRITSMENKRFRH